MEEKGGGVWGSLPIGLRHNTQRVCSHSITTISKHPNWIIELEYFFYRINVDLLSKLLGLVTCENRLPMSGHTFLALLCFGFPSFSSFFDFPSFLKFPAFPVLSCFMDLCCFSWNIPLFSFLDSSAYLTSTPSNSSNLIH